MGRCCRFEVISDSGTAQTSGARGRGSGYISQEDRVEVEAVVPSPLTTSPTLSSNRASLHNDGLLSLTYVQNPQLGPPPPPATTPNSLTVGGRLRFFWHHWQKRGTDPWVVDVLRWG